ncbi:hypothetical protein BH11BAC6_BH11BAC6_12660 [soil metagenome]
MTKMITLCLCCLCWLSACTGTRQSHNTKEVPDNNQHISLLAWNEDTTNSYSLTLFSNNKFNYVITKNDSGHAEKRSYSGTYSRVNDTIFLSYDNLQPYGPQKFLIKEASQNYLIQGFDNTNKRIFLRVRSQTGK